MTYTHSITPQAEDDVVAQYRWYLQEAGQQVAERFLAEFRSTVRLLETQPHLGRARKFRPRLLIGMRSVALGKTFQVHLIFYRVEPPEIVVLRVMHGARNLGRRLAE
jgi:toxin ParE1/3/4